MITPRRQRNVEYLDDPGVAPEIRTRAIADIAKSNRWLGGRYAALGEVRRALSLIGRSATLLDVGTGHGDLAEQAQRVARHGGIGLRTIGLDAMIDVVRNARSRLDSGACADARSLPFRDRCVDIVLCSQLLHHFEHSAALAVLAELHRVARHRVIVCDLRRGWPAVAGWRLAAPLLGLHPLTRHDGAVSILRGFTGRELSSMVYVATGVEALVRRYPGFRLAASWSP